MRKIKIVLVALVAVTFVALIGVRTWQTSVISAHQQEMLKFRDDQSIQIQNVRFADNGILLDLRTTSPVVKVIRQHNILHGVNFLDGFHTLTPLSELPFRIKPVDQNSAIVLAVPYRFAAYQEWYLELFTADGKWNSLSPYFPDRPNITENEWNEIWYNEKIEPTNK